MAEPIRDPFDRSQAIMPSGRLGMPVYAMTPGSIVLDPSVDRLVGWSDGILGPLHTTPKEGND